MKLLSVFQLSKEEWMVLMSQNAISNRGGRRKLPYVFTEHGALMLASVLNTAQAIFGVNKEFIVTNRNLRRN